MADSDVPSGLRLCRAAGWNQLARDWELFLQLHPSGCFVAETGGEVVGTVTTIRYGSDLAWLSMVLVDPAQRGKGIGTALLEAALDAVADVPCVKLDATPEGRRIYQRYGFADELRIRRMHGRAQGKLSEQAIHVDPPHPILIPDYSWQLPTGDRISGRPGHIADHLGPVIATGQAGAAELVGHACALHPNRDFFLDVVEQADWAESLGFQTRRELIRMYRGKKLPTRPGTFAIIGPEFG